ncbi:diacylglycerol kinase family protein [Ruminococcus sp. NK3A76]|uniref:diacylglycerol/lipid kinase family protein n=1 Tax=Ruminococcus sp. NK3A76 TaxID=877411 RepID=UPI00048BE968|nr:diacylglycerol kinase family protein [Ruminococcus sp. NK3A76]
MHFDIILNPAGASGRTIMLWERLEHTLTRQGCEYTLHQSSEKKGVEAIVSELTSRGEYTRLIVIGGDGTLNETVNGIKDFENTALGFIPCGTGNDMQRDMGLPKSRKALIKRLLDGEVKRTADVGELTFYGEDGSSKVRRFNISSDIGFGAATCSFADKSPLKPILNRLGLGRLIYLVHAVRVCFTAKPANVVIRYDGKGCRYRKCLSAIAMNHCHEGGGFKFCPDAKYDDGLLDIVVGTGLTKLGFLRMLPLAYKGRHLKLRGIYSHKAKEVEMISDIPLWAHTDGEVLGQARRVKMRVTGEKLRLLV